MKLQYYLLNSSKYISNFSANTGKERVNGNKIERKIDTRVLLDTFCLANYVKNNICSEGVEDIDKDIYTPG